MDTMLNARSRIRRLEKDVKEMKEVIDMILTSATTIEKEMKEVIDMILTSVTTIESELFMREDGLNFGAELKDLRSDLEYLKGEFGTYVNDHEEK